MKAQPMGPHFNFSSVTFSGAMYLPYAKGDISQHCSSKSIDVSGNNVHGGDYVIKQTADPTDAFALNTTWTTYVEPNKDALLDHVL